MSVLLEEVLKDNAIRRRLEFNPCNFSFPVAPVVRVAVEDWLPHVGLRHDRDGKLEAFGPMAKIIETLAASINFTYQLIRPLDGAWGVKLENGSWTGMVGMVLRNEADIALGPFAMKEDRAKVVDYTSALVVDYNRLVVRQNPPEADHWGFLAPFSVYTWLGIFISLFGIAAALQIFSKTSRNLSVPSHLFIFYRNLYMLARVILQQDLCIKSKKDIVRLLFGTWFLFVLVITHGYSGTLTSLLAVRQIPRDINTLRDAIDNPHLKVVFEGGSAISSFVQNSKAGIFGELNKLYSEERILERRTTEHRSTLREEIFNGDAVLILEHLSIRSLLSAEFSASGQCEFYTPNDYFLPWIFCMIGQKHHPLLKAISFKVKRITTAGLYMQWLNQMLPNGSACGKPVSFVSVSEPYSITRLWGIFALLICGLMTSMGVYFLELILNERPSLSSILGCTKTLYACSRNGK